MSPRGYRSRKDADRNDEKKTKKTKKTKKAAGGFTAERSEAAVVSGAQPEPNGRKADDEEAQIWLEETQPSQGRATL